MVGRDEHSCYSQMKKKNHTFVIKLDWYEYKVGYYFCPRRMHGNGEMAV